MVSPSSPAPSPKHILATLQAYRDAAALDTAIELDLFTRIAHGADTTSKIANGIGIPVRGIRLLCEYLAGVGLLEKEDEQVRLTGDAAYYLDRQSPGFLGDKVHALRSPELVRGYQRLTETMQAGKAARPVDADASVRADWFDLALGITQRAAATQAFADALNFPPGQKLKILEVGGEGDYGIAVALRYPDSVIVAVDCPGALRSAQEKAEAAKLGSRYQNIPGDPLTVPYGMEFDAVLMVRNLYDFDESQTTSLMMRVHFALKKTGRFFILEFLSDDTPEFERRHAGVRLDMLAAIPTGDAYTVTHLKGLLESSGFREVETQLLKEARATLVTARP